eukprot:scaffold327750_cov18-Prasinocladus_malaysianus.AAC.1
MIIKPRAPDSRQRCEVATVPYPDEYGRTGSTTAVSVLRVPLSVSPAIIMSYGYPSLGHRTVKYDSGRYYDEMM